MKCLSIVTYLTSSLRALLAICVLSSAAPALSMSYYERPEKGEAEKGHMELAASIMIYQMGGILNFTRIAVIPMTFQDSPQERLRKRMHNLAERMVCGSLPVAVQTWLSDCKHSKIEGIEHDIHAMQLDQKAQNTINIEPVLPLEWQAPSEQEVLERQEELEDWYLEHYPSPKYRTKSGR